MTTEVFENKIRGFSAMLSGLESLSRDICVNCINLESAKTKASKMIKKATMDLEKAPICCEMTRGDIKNKLYALSTTADELRIADETSCQKTADVCKLGEGCFATGLVDLMKLVPEEV